jgi:hypothetical protein
LGVARLAVALVAFVVAVGVAITSVVPSSVGRVSGGITRCEALTTRPLPGETRYVAGTVQVLRGDAAWVPDASDSAVLHDVLPTEVVAQETVGFGERYSFDLPPGHYVLNRLVNAGSALQYTSFVLNPGEERTVNIPNTCI